MLLRSPMEALNGEFAAILAGYLESMAKRIVHRDSVGVPRVDPAIDIDEVRDEAEEIAVPAFDYIAQPIDAVIDGVLGHRHDEDLDTEDTQVDVDPHAADERKRHPV